MYAYPGDFDVGSVFYECEYGRNIEAEVLTKPIKTQTDVFGSAREHFTWEAVSRLGKVIQYSWTEGFSNTYGPRLYTEPQYIRFKDGNAEYILE